MPEALRVKFCGFSRPEDVEEALRLGVDYVGFVFVPRSPRFLDVEQALQWLPGLDTGPACRVGVFRDEPARRVNEIARRLRLDVVQLHGHEPRDYPRSLDFPVFVVRRAALRAPVGRWAAPAREFPAPNVRAVIVDVEDPEGRSGGLGVQAPDESLRRTLDGLSRGIPVFLSGGLTPGNVAERVARYAPFGVDVSSGIEGAPGRKDPTRMREFMQALGRVV